jgi:hypothetical protein
MSYASVPGIGSDEILTQDPPPSAYCKSYIAQIAALQADLVNAGRSCDSRLSQAGASAAGAASGAGRAISDLNQKILSLQAELANAGRSCDTRLSSCQAGAAGQASGMSQAIDNLNKKLAAAQADLAAKKCRSCLIWIVIACAGAGISIFQAAKSKDKSKKSLEKKLPELQA